jgi:dynein heavy chain, axonemal
MVATFKLCSEQLSSQDHYDYGMRAVKSTITACGNLKGAAADDPEDELVLRGLRDINVPKFLAPDLPLFHGIIADLFPGVAPPPVDYSALTAALAAACAAATPTAIQPVQPFLAKVRMRRRALQRVPVASPCTALSGRHSLPPSTQAAPCAAARGHRTCARTQAIQLYETTLVRHGLMLVGATMAGKTCAYRALAEAMTALSQHADGAVAARFSPVRVTALNPKAVTMGQLYGEFDANTHEWTDGVLACHMRLAAEDTSNAKKWLMFDGCAVRPLPRLCGPCTPARLPDAPL